MKISGEITRSPRNAATRSVASPWLRRSRKSIVGPNPSRRFCHHGPPVSSGSALTTTPFASRSRDKPAVSAKAGISVSKRDAEGPPAGAWVGRWNTPWIAEPLEVI